ncbi:MAG: hypothetical protein AB8H80_10075 [Planctomycetota bacterium]
MTLTPLLLAAALFQGPGSTASIDDSDTHGQVGDSLLSLDEAIRLANGSLATSALSAAEQARLSGTGAVTTIRIDAASLPTVTTSAALTPLSGQGSEVLVEGVQDASGSWPMLVGQSQQTTLSLRSHRLRVMGLSFAGGDIAIDAKMPAMTNPNMPMPMVMNCTFDGQTDCGIQLRATGTDATMLMVNRARFTNMPLGYRVEDMTTSGRIMSNNEFITFDGVTTGCSAFEGGNGNTTMFALWRSTFDNGETLCRSTRSTSATTLFMFRLVYVDATCTGDVVDCEGQSAGTTMVHHHHGDWTAGAGKRALWTHPRTGQFDVHGSEMVFRGDIEISGSTSSPRFWHQNNRFFDSAITYDVDGALPNLLWNRYENCSITVPASARSPIDIRSSHLINTTVDAQSFLAPVDLVGCWRPSGTMSGFSSETGSYAGAFLGQTEVTPREPQVGGSMQLYADLPQDIALIWDIAPSDPRPITSQEPVRFYGDPNQIVILPAIAIFQSTLTVPLPNSPALVGSEWYVQGIALPLTGGTGASGFYLPRGERITLR